MRCVGMPEHATGQGHALPKSRDSAIRGTQWNGVAAGTRRNHSARSTAIPSRPSEMSDRMPSPPEMDDYFHRLITLKETMPPNDRAAAGPVPGHPSGPDPKCPAQQPSC